MARFFIDRPVLAWVLALVLMLAGVLSILTLPIAQYPTIAPPAIAITAIYPGASAKTLEDTVTQVIEQRMKGIDRLAYITSTSDSSGQATITVTFENGTNPDTAQVQVQNKLALATPLLPQEVQQQGVQVAKAANNFLLIIAFISTDGRMSGGDLADYVAANVQDPLSRIEGVGDTTLFGSPYAMRIWLDPNKLNAYKLTAQDVGTAIRAKNVQVSAGQLGAQPTVTGQELNATITAQTRLNTAEQFAAIVLRTDAAGAKVLLSDVARIELGSESYDIDVSFNGKQATGLAIELAPGANALETVQKVSAELAVLEKLFPAGMKSEQPYDTTPFVRLSIEEVVTTLVIAIVLVFLVMYLFLQNFRATLIPTIAVPVVLLGTFCVIYVAGYNINTLTMFALVLAIGLLVDDAIVVVENVERVMHDERLSPLEATRKSMDQITSALVGVAMVLAAVFVPMAFFGGSVGAIYRQFSITMGAAMTLSVLVALILTPALCATLLKPAAKAPTGTKIGLVGRFFGGFNRMFDHGNERYHAGVGGMINRPWPSMIVYLVIVAAMAFGFVKLSSGFLPDEDQGTLFVSIQLPPGANRDRTLEVLSQVRQHFLVDRADAVSSIFTVAGFSFAGNGQNMGLAFVRLKPWDERATDELKVDAVSQNAMGVFSKITDARVFAFAPPAVSELGNASGFDLQLQDRANLGHAGLLAARNQLLGMAGQEPGIIGLRPNGQEDTPQLELALDEQKAGALGISLADINDNLSATWGGSYVNDFIDKGRVKKVFLQADAPFRMLPQDIDRWYVRNQAGEMVPFASFASATWTSGPPRLERFNGMPSMEILGMGEPGTLSSGEAMLKMEELIGKLPPGIGFEWTGLSRQERTSGSQLPLLYGLSLLIVFFCLAALYESWAIPVAVLLVVPLGILGTVAAALLLGHVKDVYFQIALLTTVGLASKNAILIVQFAKEQHAAGVDIVESALEAARLRLRPILMTSIAFILGVLPMALGSGAGSGAQNALGSAVIGGMISATVLAIMFVPVFYVLVVKLSERFGRKDDSKSTDPQPADTNPVDPPFATPVGAPQVAGSAAILLAGALAASCALGPNYKRPAIATPGAFRNADATLTAPEAASLADLKWFDLFQDPTLTQLVTTALERNFDLRIAAERVLQARALLRISRSDQFPSVDGSASIDRSRASTVGSAMLPSGVDPEITVGQIGFSLGWELDVWGRLRRLTESARAQYLATEEGRRGVVNTLIADVTDTYLRLRQLDDALAVAIRTRDAGLESLQLTTVRLTGGVATGLDVSQAEQLLYTAAARIASTQRDIGQTENALSLLLGRSPGDVARGYGLNDFRTPPTVPAGLPSSLLERRPDIRQAEQTLISANAEIGAAKAEYLPRISLTGFLGAESQALSTLLTSPARVWSVGASAVAPIFNAGRTRGNVQFRESVQREAVASYEKTIYGAFREVSDALIEYRKTTEEREQQARLVDALRNATRLSTSRYQGGLDSYLQVLDARRNLFNGELTLTQLRRQELSSVVELYRTLGGGWEPGMKERTQ